MASPFFLAIPPNTTMHQTCCCQLCFADVEGVSEPADICLILTITELEVEMSLPSLAPNSAPNPLLPFPTAAQHFHGKSLGMGSWCSSIHIILPSAAPSHFPPAAFSGLCFSLGTLVRQPSLPGVKISLRWSWLLFPSLFAKSDTSLSRFPGIVGLTEKHKMCKGYW